MNMKTCCGNSRQIPSDMLGWSITVDSILAVIIDLIMAYLIVEIGAVPVPQFFAEAMYILLVIAFDVSVAMLGIVSAAAAWLSQ